MSLFNRGGRLPIHATQTRSSARNAAFLEVEPMKSSIRSFAEKTTGLQEQQCHLQDGEYKNNLAIPEVRTKISRHTLC